MISYTEKIVLMKKVVENYLTHGVTEKKSYKFITEKINNFTPSKLPIRLRFYLNR